MNKILVADDDRSIQMLYAEELEEEGYDFTGATSGDSAFSLMHQCQPDLIILDITMPGLNGFQVLDLIRRKSRVPVIMLIGRGDMTTLRESMEIGADDFIRKPFYSLELVARVRAKLRRAAQSNSQSQDVYDKMN